MGVKNELQDIISGVGVETGKDLIQAAAYYLRKSQKASRNSEKTKLNNKEQETKELIVWINRNELWFLTHDENRFIASGAEQRVYLHQDERFVYKLNDTIFYQLWKDYFHSLLIHNYFFPRTAYELIGFYQTEGTLQAVVKQPFIELTEVTKIESIKAFLTKNGFLEKKNNDYFNTELGLILEDLHDENVLTNNGILFFIDTIFYLKPSFFRK